MKFNQKEKKVGYISKEENPRKKKQNKGVKLSKLKKISFATTYELKITIDCLLFK